jgi:NitT/TauT family transport system substrate-binding protein
MHYSVASRFPGAAQDSLNQKLAFRNLQSKERAYNGRVSHRSLLCRVAALVLVALWAAGCSRTPGPAAGDHMVLRVGYFPNITHSQALIGLARGDFQKSLGSKTVIKPVVFNAGPSVIEAMFAGQLDLAYIGPNPAINGFVQSKGRALRIVAGATSGGASLIVKTGSGIKDAGGLAGKRIASPQLGNTQDVALRNFLASKGIRSAERGGGAIVIPTPNPQILDLFRRGEIDGAWVPEPWASRLIVEGGGTLFLDERELWPGGDFVTAHVIASTELISRFPGVIEAWLRAHVEVTRWELENPAAAMALVDSEIERLVGKKLGSTVLSMSWQRFRPTWDPIAVSLVASAESAYAAGFLKNRPDLSGIYDLRILNQVLRSAGLAEIQAQPGDKINQNR